MKKFLLASLSVLAAAGFFMSQLQADQEKDQPVGDERDIKLIEEEWAKALVKRDLAAIDKFVSPDWLFIDSDGDLVDKAQSDADLKSGDYMVESFKIESMKVRVFESAAVAHVLATEKSKYKGKDTSGKYYYTDVFTKSKGRWMAVSSHSTRVPPKK